MADKTDLSFKKIVGRQYTSTAKEWYEEHPVKPFNLNGADIWMDDIPAIPPSSTTSGIEVYNTLTLQEDVTVNNEKCWLAENPVGIRIGDFIPPRYGQGYTVRVYDGSNNEILTTDGSGWFFDYTSGILTFDNDPGGYGHDDSAFKLKVYRYIGQTADDITISSGTLNASDINNNSTVSGTTVKDALEILNTDSDVSRFKYNQHLNTISGTRIYSLPDSPVANTVQVHVNGLLQEPGIGNDYTISSQIITFTQDLALDDVLLAHYIT
jgi:hypothetical protein